MLVFFSAPKHGSAVSAVRCDSDYGIRAAAFSGGTDAHDVSGVGLYGVDLRVDDCDVDKARQIIQREE